MKEILIAIAFFLLFIGIVLAILFHEYVRKFRQILRQLADAREARRMAEEDAYFRRTSNKYYREDDTPKFKDGYFKGRNEQARYDQARYGSDASARRPAGSDAGVDVIDGRQPAQADRKIFGADEGEYVEFEEVK